MEKYVFKLLETNPDEIKTCGFRKYGESTYKNLYWLYKYKDKEVITLIAQIDTDLKTMTVDVVNTDNATSYYPFYIGSNIKNHVLDDVIKNYKAIIKYLVLKGIIKGDKK